MLTHCKQSSKYQTKILETMISEGVPVTIVNEHGLNLLHHCCLNLAEDIATILLRADCGSQLINQKDNNGWTPLHTLIIKQINNEWNGFPIDFLFFLLDMGADVNAKNINGNTMTLSF
jgi:ankyrin repeat protein